MLEQNTVEHGAFYQRKSADCRAVIQLRTYHRQISTKRLQRLGINAAFNSREQHFIGFGDFSGNNNFLRVKQVDGNGDGFAQMTTNLLNHFRRQAIAFVRSFADSFDGTVVQRHAALVALL